MSSAQQIKIRRIVWTGAITAVTVVGAVTGARLKADQEGKQQVEKSREASIEQRIAVLEEQRGSLVAKKLDLERKIKQVEMKAQGATWEESRQGVERKRG
ncbi:hypothetical protein CJF30_00009956 [Rutstroemia sp. NJR-2017a BBW]|nr:hypothetical protein CJF30_00009956 [Rutstroemia sp. NJR-2017a BBW]